MKLVIIESPGKKDALQKYLGKDYIVMSSKGHVRDLPEKTLGVDLLHNFEPKYEVLADKKEVVSSLKKKAEQVDEVLLATDPDREGEAISWHIAHCLNINENSNCRIEFNEISKQAVEAALKCPKPINLKLVDAQQARRVLDRIVGYKLSPILCKKISSKLSAGRVQSVCLKMVVDRENEIKSFIPEEYWTITAKVEKTGEKPDFKLILANYKNKKIKVTCKEEADKIIKELDVSEYIVSKIKKSKIKTHALPPFTTSTMQQDALNKIGLSLKRTSACAQMLYEGVDVEGEGKLALITYIRTDSTRVSQGAQNMALEYITQKYGKDYVPNKPNIYTAKKNAQDAHEAIRPISLAISPEKIKNIANADVYKLYKLIYERFIASQMAEAEYNNVAVEVKSGDYTLKASGKTMDFAGFTAVYKTFTDSDDKEENAKLPKMAESDLLNLIKTNAEQKFTKPPVRYTEASLVKAMEEEGIGRPATYTPTVTLLFSRNYTEKEGKFIIPTQLGVTITEYLEKYFKSVINVKFTAHMEERLDDISINDEKWQDVVNAFWEGFSKLLKNADEKSVAIKKEVVYSDKICDKCGSKMVVREGRFGKFLGCSNFPKCKNIISLEPETPKETGICPVCGKVVNERRSKTGKTFFGCSGYPECKFLSWDLPTGEKCEACGEYMVKTKKGIIKCSKCGQTKK